MPQQLISRNADLKQLRDEGHEVEVKSGHLLVRNVPYLDAGGALRRGTLVSELTLAGDVTTKPATHVAHFAGEYPCDHKGAPLDKIRNQSETRDLGDGVVVNHSFSSKPTGGYANFHDKMTTYIRILSGPAAHCYPDATAATFAPVSSDDDRSPFVYHDTASSRAGIVALNQQFEQERVGIIGLGGTGSYILDLVAKTPVREIRLFDPDVFSQHNAFRAPGAADLAVLREQPKKVDYLKGCYDRMHRGIVAHALAVDMPTLNLLEGLSFVFLAIDSGAAKRAIIADLERREIPFIDVGLGVTRGDDALHGIVRVTSSTPAQRDHVRQRISLGGSDANEYATNIQVADLNALNASLAVIKWKKIRNFYADLAREHHTTYTIDGNLLLSEDTP